MAAVHTQNPFDLLGGSDDEGAAPKKQTQKVKKKEAAPKAAAAARGGRGAKGNSRNTRGGRAPGATRKHEQDRRSAGRGKGDVRKGGHGKFNWDSNKDTVRNAESEPTEAEKPEPEQPEDAAIVVEKDEDDNIGYDEYVKRLEAKRPEDDQLETREVEVDESKWAGEELKVEEEVDEYVMAKKTKKSKAKAAKKMVHLDEFVGSKSGGSGGRGAKGGRGRAGYRNGRGGGRGRGGKSSPQIQMDEKSFPKLG